MDSELKVLFVAAEAAPFAQVGGLAEFAGALPKALRTLGVDARIVIPRYGDRHSPAGSKPRRVGGTIPVPVGSSTEPAQLLATEQDGVPVYLIYNDQHFGNRERVYGFNDDPQRFVFFSRAVLAALKSLDWLPDVIHATDWHTAPIPAWLDVYGRTLAPYSSIASLFTVRNFTYQGLCGRLLLSFAQMADLPHLPVEPPGKVNWLAQGIAHADIISTVSPTHAQEMLGTDLGGDLQTLLESRKDRLFGILSGIDTQRWDPSADEMLPQTFDEATLNMRSVNKTALQRELRLATDLDVPLVGVVARLDPQKGLDLLFGAVEHLLQSRDLRFVLLGMGQEDLVEQSQALQARYPRSVRALIRFDERMARRIYGGVDLFVMPSRYEAGGVGVMTAMHYGAVPLVRAVGGLADMVVDDDAQPEHGNGFSFAEFSGAAVLDALTRALAAYDDEARWVGLQRRAMSRDFSWRSSAQAYLDLYARARALRAERPTPRRV